jgi:hypothetical protein
MPRITTYAIPLQTVQRASRALVDELVALTSSAREHFVLRVNQDPFVRDGEVVTGDPFVEVALFARDAEVEDAVARAVTKHLKDAGSPAPDVYLVHLERRRYFEDGAHF